MTLALVTGGYGFVGSHLRPLLHERGWEVVMLGRAERSADANERYVRCDLTQTDAVVEALADTRPDFVFHLAASLPQREGRVERVVADAAGGTLALCIALTRLARSSRLVVAGTSAQYGDIPLGENPVTEETRCRPINAYGHAKLAAEAIALAFNGRDLEVVPVRPFNLVGPGETDATVGGSLTSQIIRVLEGQATHVRVHDLEAVRDFTDVRDLARAYLAIAERATPGRVYNVCSGYATRVADLLDGLLAAAGLDESVAQVEPGGGRGIRYQVGSADRLRDETGWTTTIPLIESLADLLRGRSLRSSATAGQ